MSVTRCNSIVRCFIVLVVITLLHTCMERYYYRYATLALVGITPSGAVELQQKCKLLTHDVRTGLGNQMFAFASSLGISMSVELYKTNNTNNAKQGQYGGNWCVCIESTSTMRNIFFPLSDWLACQVDNITYKNSSYVYTHRSSWARYDKLLTQNLSIVTRDVLLSNYLQSWRYFRCNEHLLRQLFRFNESVLNQANDVITDAIQRNAPNGSFRCNSCHCNELIKVGVHVRRGDYLLNVYSRRGFSVATEGYLMRSFKHFDTNLLLPLSQQLLFVVVSEDITWCRRHITKSWLKRGHIVFIHTGNIAVDLAVLSLCNHTILTSGSYGWWAAWLVNGTTIYYSKFPRSGSQLANGFKASDYYKPNWIGMA